VSRPLVKALKLVSLALLCVIGLQAHGLLRESHLRDVAPGLEVSPAGLGSPAASLEPGGETESAVQDGAQPGKPASTPPVPPLPAEYQPIALSGIFGKAPEQKPPPPALVGVAGSRALIRAPSGKWELLAEGGELEGIKVIAIATNRVLVEFEGQLRELTIFEGLGSSSLYPPAAKDSKQ
jgi:hypothetical protein